MPSTAQNQKSAEQDPLPALQRDPRCEAVEDRSVVDLAQITVRGFGRIWPSVQAPTYECSRRSHSDLATT